MPKRQVKDLDEMLQAERRKKAKQSGKGAIVPAIPTGPKGGITKRKKAAAPAPSSLNGRWTHDLHATVAPAKQYKSLGATNGAKAPIIITPTVAQKLASNKLFEALHGVGGAKGAVAKQAANDLGINIRGASKAASSGISIKGSAGPFAVHGSNFAPGTTASDIRNVLESRGLSVINCGILSASPTVIAEILFERRDDAQKCVEEFNNRLADGRLLHFMIKDAPQLPANMRTRAPQNQTKTQAVPIAKSIPTGPKGSANIVVDGKYGFSQPRNAGSGLYSDAMVMRKGRGNASMR